MNYYVAPAIGWTKKSQVITTFECPYQQLGSNQIFMAGSMPLAQDIYLNHFVENSFLRVISRYLHAAQQIPFWAHRDHKYHHPR